MIARTLRLLLTSLCLISVLCICGCGATGPAQSPDDQTDDPAGQPFVDRVGSGDARVTGVVMSADSENAIPLGGVQVTLGDSASRSNVDGSFELYGAIAGKQELLIDGGALHAGDGRYAQLTMHVEVPTSGDVVIDQPVYLPFVSKALLVDVEQDRLQIASGDNLVSLQIRPGSARQDGKEYTDEISIQRISPERTLLPLTGPVAEDARYTIFVQPAGIDFQVPATVSISDDAPIESDYALLWRWDGSTGKLVRSAIMTRRGNFWETASGGVPGSGIYLLSDFRIPVVYPCDESDADARSCMHAWQSLYGSLAESVDGLAPGAKTVLGRLEVSLAQRRNTVEQAGDIIQLTEDLYETAAGLLPLYRSAYRELGDVSSIEAALADVQAFCESMPTCGGGSSDLGARAISIGRQIADLKINVSAFASSMDRLAAATEALSDFYGSFVPIAEDELGAFSKAADEFVQAYAAFAPFSSPMVPYDALVDAIVTAHDESLMAAHEIADSSFQAPTLLMSRVDPLLGCVRIAGVDEAGLITWPLSSSDDSERESLIFGIDLDRELCSLPMYEADFGAHTRVGAVLSMDRRPDMQSTVLGGMESGLLTFDSPAAVWTFGTEQRSMINVSFDSDGPAMIGFATADGVLRIVGDSGFEVANLPNDRTAMLMVLAPGLERGEEISYSFSVELVEGLFDFNTPVVGRFDVHNRASAILFDATAGERVLIEKKCCDPSGTLFGYTVLGPDGAEVPCYGTGGVSAGIGGGLCDIEVSGLHRVVIAPFEGEFADYQIAVHSVTSNPPRSLELNTPTTAQLDEVGETARYTLQASAGEEVKFVGVGSQNIDPAMVSVVGPSGQLIWDDELLYFDGSTFSSRSFAALEDGTYEVSFRSAMSSPSGLTGLLTFRVEIMPYLSQTVDVNP